MRERRTELAPLYAMYNDVPPVSDQRCAAHAATQARWVATIHHGLPDALHRFAAGPGRHLLFLGRISPEKRPDAAIRVARRAGIPLRIAAKVDAVDREYFDQRIRPLLDDPLIDFIGEVETSRRTLAGVTAGMARAPRDSRSARLRRAPRPGHHPRPPKCRGRGDG